MRSFHFWAEGGAWRGTRSDRSLSETNEDEGYYIEPFEMAHEAASEAEASAGRPQSGQRYVWPHTVPVAADTSCRSVLLGPSTGTVDTGGIGLLGQRVGEGMRARSVLFPLSQGSQPNVLAAQRWLALSYRYMY